MTTRFTNHFNRNIYGILHKLETNRVRTSTSGQFCARIVAGPLQGERLQLDGGIRPGPSWSLLLKLPLVPKSSVSFSGRWTGEVGINRVAGD